MTVTRTPPAAGSLGYTLIELVLVIVIAGILAAVGAPHFFDQATFAQRGYADELAGAFRMAQKAAVASDCPAEVVVAAGAYAVKQQAASGNTCNPSDATWSTAVIGPDGQTVQNSAPNGVVASPAGTWVYNGAGALSTAPATSITVGTHTLSLDATTGYVQVQ